MFLTKFAEEIEARVLRSITFFFSTKIVFFFFIDNVKNIIDPDRPQGTI